LQGKEFSIWVEAFVPLAEAFVPLAVDSQGEEFVAQAEEL